MMKQNFAVLGAGNGGQVIAAYLKLKGKHVTLYDRFSQVLEPIRRRGGIQLEGVSDTGFAKLDLVTEDVPQAVQGGLPRGHRRRTGVPGRLGLGRLHR